MDFILIFYDSINVLLIFYDDIVVGLYYICQYMYMCTRFTK